MKKLLVLLVSFGILTALAIAVPARAIVINFDDLHGDGAPIPTTYAGLTWSNTWYSVDPTLPPFIAGSSPTTAYLEGYSGTVHFPSLVNFNGLWISSNENVQISGGGYSTTIAPTLGAFVPLNWQTNDLTFVLEQKYGAFFDNLTYAAVPLPPGAVLLATGLLSLLGFGAWRRK